MIVKCRDNSYKKSLSQGKEYFVFEQKSNGYYKIINDFGDKEDCEIERFTTVIQNEKELNIIEANNMPIGTEFIVKFKDGRIETVHIKTITNESGTKLFLWCDNEEVKTYNALLNSIFIPLQRSVSFMKALNSGKFIRIKHEIISELLKNNSYLTIDEALVKQNYKSLKKDEPLRPNSILTILSWAIESEKIAEIINEAECFIIED